MRVSTSRRYKLSGCLLGRWGRYDRLGRHVPGQQFGDAVDGVLGNAREHVAQIGFGIESVELGRADEAVDGGGALAAGVGSGEEVVLATDCDSTQSAFGRVVINLQLTVAAIAQ